MSTSPETLDRAYAFVMAGIVRDGFAPHFTALAKAFGMEPEAGKQLLHDLMASGIPCWLYPETDHVASFAPFNSQPTQYRVSVDGESRWFAQCGFEALAVNWLFPGKPITVRAPCLDCGEPMEVAMRDGVLQHADPAELAAYVDLPFPNWRDHALGFT